MSTLGPLSGCERTKSGHPETDIDDPKATSDCEKNSDDFAKRLAPATWNNSHIGRHRV